jgi:long-chain acyl-CoA synthetase
VRAKIKTMLDPTKPPATLSELAQRSFVHHGAQPYLGAKKEGTYQFESYAQIAQRVRLVAGGLLSLGLERGDRAAILAESRPEWAIADLACQMIGVISVPLFSTLPPPQVQYILQDSGAKAVFVSTTAQREKIAAIVDQVLDLRAVVTMDSAAAAPTGELEVLSFEALEKRGEIHLAVHPDDYEASWPAAQPNDVATIIYTSGTTGNPKGAMLTHRNIVADLEAILRSIPEISPSFTFLSFLPLAHVYERTAGYYLPTRLGAPIAFCESLFTVDKNLLDVKPNVMFCVPRLHETMRDKILAQAKTMPEGKRAKFQDALELAKKAGAYEGGLPGAPSLGLGEKLKLKIYDAMVYAKVREKFGGKLWAFVSGGAPMSPELGALFLGMGVTVLEGYGLTETSPVISVNRPGQVRLGTVGPVLDGVQVKIADDGEICVRGDTVMKGYWNKPDETREVMDAEGWFHTGDLGTMENGCLKITGRKKDLIVLANGKKVAPAPIELRLAESPYISQIVLLGDKQKAVSALIVPHVERVREWAKENNVQADSDAALLQTPAVQGLLRKEIDARSDSLADFEKIRKVALLTKPFSVEEGEVTPTLKIKRNVIAQKYGSLVLEET